MKKIIVAFLFLFPLSIVLASESKKAYITGTEYLGMPGVAKIKLGDQRCTVSSSGGAKEKTFRILFTCNEIAQVLWDINVPVEGDFSFDEPHFKLLWAGDEDSDGKIDIIMDMSPKYSCTKEVTYLSGKATKGQLVGISGSPKTVCGA
jgi:hypothetical protein